jgi:MPBQ/MSBQ methyltransferase
MNSHDILIPDEIDDFYRHIRGYWGHLSAPQTGSGSGMLNFGYWKDDCPDLYNAQLNFLENLLNTIDHQSCVSNGLEIGCGIGGISIGVLNKLPNSRMAAIDISPDQLKIAHDNAKIAGLSSRLTFREESSMEMSFDSNFFDFTLCIESSFHYADKKSFFDENFRVLKAGGQAVLADITCENVERIAFRKGNHFESWSYYVALAEESGFVVESVEDVGLLVYPQLYQFILKFNKQNREFNGKYWSVVLRNYAILAKEKLMGYHFFRFRKPI